MDYSINSEFVRDFDRELSDLVQQGVQPFDEELFNRLALKEFEIQYNCIEFYKDLCDRDGVNPGNVETWDQIPPVPSAAFKSTVLAAFPLYETELTLMTSGTSNPASPAKIYRDKRCVDLYYKANATLARNYLFPDVERMRILLMIPSPKLAPSMGMAVGLEQLRQTFGTEDSMYLITPNGMEWELLFSALHEAEESGVPAALVGATSGLVYLYNFCREQGLTFRLPRGSRICDGGGYLGTFGECSREEYLSLCDEILGVQPEYCVNTLGSGESTTNYFDNVLRDYHLGIKNIARYKESPPWARTIVVDPHTGLRLPKGEVGLLRHYDLINRANVLAVQTSNLGYETEGGFEIIGRCDAKGLAESTVLNRMIRGAQNPGATCSTVADGMLQGDATCSTVADGMLQGDAICSTVADGMLQGGSTCSTAADELLRQSPHGKMFNGISKDRLEKLKKMCPFLRLQGLFRK